MFMGFFTVTRNTASEYLRLIQSLGFRGIERMPNKGSGKPNLRSLALTSSSPPTSGSPSAGWLVLSRLGLFSLVQSLLEHC